MSSNKPDLKLLGQVSQAVQEVLDVLCGTFAGALAGQPVPAESVHCGELLGLSGGAAARGLSGAAGSRGHEQAAHCLPWGHVWFSVPVLGRTPWPF